MYNVVQSLPTTSMTGTSLSPTTMRCGAGELSFCQSLLVTSTTRTVLTLTPVRHGAGELSCCFASTICALWCVSVVFYLLLYVYDACVVAGM